MVGFLSRVGCGFKYLLHVKIFWVVRTSVSTNFLMIPPPPEEAAWLRTLGFWCQAT
jgi:hypothetical protein